MSTDTGTFCRLFATLYRNGTRSINRLSSLVSYYKLHTNHSIYINYNEQ